MNLSNIYLVSSLLFLGSALSRRLGAEPRANSFSGPGKGVFFNNRNIRRGNTDMYARGKADFHETHCFVNLTGRPIGSINYTARDDPASS
jgi:hypothetical protein